MTTYRKYNKLPVWNDQSRALLGARLSRAMQGRDMNDAQLAAYAGIPLEDVRGYLAGRQEMTCEDLNSFCYCLGVTADWMLGLSTVMNSLDDMQESTADFRARLMMLTVMHTTSVERIAAHAGIDHMRMTQLSRGDEQPTAGQIYLIAVAETASADWLVGLSNKDTRLMTNEQVNDHRKSDERA